MYAQFSGMLYFGVKHCNCRTSARNYFVYDMFGRVTMLLKPVWKAELQMGHVWTCYDVTKTCLEGRTTDGRQNRHTALEAGSILYALRTMVRVCEIIDAIILTIIIKIKIKKSNSD
jgi:hypothetical protein